jgi:acetyltransferase
LFAAARLPTYDTPEKATRGFMHLVRYRRGQETLMEVPPSIPPGPPPDRAAAKAILKGAAVGWLEAEAVQRLLQCYRIPVAASLKTRTPAEAATAAAKIGHPVAIKIMSPDITHKSELGGVLLNVTGENAVRAAASAMQDRIAKLAPSARLDGFLVQEMVQRPHALELIVGMAIDRTFGPFLLFGQGGTAVEVIDDKALGLPPLNIKLAREMIARTKVARLLKGYRDHPPAALDAIALTLVYLSQLICDFPQIAELDINPLLADEEGVIALDARVRVEDISPSHRPLAIRPYPDELARTEIVPGVGTFLLRPVRPEDAPAFEVLFRRLQPDDVHMRFFTSMTSLPVPLLSRLTQIDYDREMAFVLVNSAKEAVGVARIAADPDNLRAEFALLVRSDMKGHGLGRLLMNRLIGYARERGIAELWGDILAENSVMLSLCNEAGCTIAPSPVDPGVKRASIRLGAD